MTIKAIITGSTGMVGEGVLHECLQRPEVVQVLVINRKPCGVVHPKLKEILHDDFLNLQPITKQLQGYNACYFCLGVTSVGKKEPEYKKLTYYLTLHMALLLVKESFNMTFCYVSGAGTRSDEKGSMWAIVKGKTENALLKLPFKKAYMFRPGYIQPTPGLLHAHKFYKYLKPLYKPLRALFPKYFISLKEVGDAMINVTLRGYTKQIIEVKDIAALAKN